MFKTAPSRAAQIPLGRAGKPCEFGRAAAFVLSCGRVLHQWRGDPRRRRGVRVKTASSFPGHRFEGAGSQALIPSCDRQEICPGVGVMPTVIGNAYVGSHL